MEEKVISPHDTPAARHAPRRLRDGGLSPLVLFLVVVLCLWIFVAIADEVLEGDSRPFDRAVITALRTSGDLGDPLGPLWLEEGVRDITALGSNAVLGLITLAVAGFLALAGRPRHVLFLLVAVAGGLLLGLALKAGFDRPRPDFLPHGQAVFTRSFPSGHAMNAAVVYLTLGSILAGRLASRLAKAYVLMVSMAVTVLVGLSRVYLGVHWPTDVVAGWSAGAAWAVLCHLALRGTERAGVMGGRGGAGHDG